MKFWILFLLMCEVAFSAIPVIPEDSVKAAEWKMKRMEELSLLDRLSDEEKIAKSGEMARQLGTLNYRDCQEKSEVYSAIQKYTTSIPGHAEYYEKRIKESEEAVKSSIGTDDYGKKLAEAGNEKAYGFQTLGQLPSVETVRVLGDFLFNDDAYEFPSLDDSSSNPSPASTYALRAFGQLPLVNPPVKVGKYRADREHNLHPFRLWYQQVKAGTRTFRFEGDPQEYDLNGPVREARVPNAANARRRGEPATREAAPAKQEGGSVAIVIAVLAAFGLCGGALWYAKVKA